MDYRHLTIDELARQIGAQVGNDLELEGELVRRVVAGEVLLTSTDALAEKQEEIVELQEEVSELNGKLDKAREAFEALNEKVGEALGT